MEHPARRDAMFPNSAPDGVAEHRQARSGASNRKLRLFYFGLASLWGYLLGAGMFAAGSAAEGRAIHVGTMTMGIAIAGAGLALGGGLLASAAYREARRRRGR